ncbi:hypothetical protein CYMTET_16387 [Cymbomonas tetramitiformis]|uniref:Uncharacterized protein n=1 Tax=Cymbomonas tetramitiformis TaxID=36881 RepID=A0AAE0L8D2_9CHLO|nr:hypothetical protein CYMTET_16387 [Cymbomonas tetramitiformis]
MPRQVTAREFYGEALLDAPVLVPAGSFNAEWNIRPPDDGESEDDFDEGAPEEEMPAVVDAESEESEDECVLSTP